MRYNLDLVMKKTKVKFGEFDKEINTSVVILNSPIGEFTGYAFSHPDEIKPSRFFGCGIAHQRAMILCAKECIKINKYSIKTLISILTQTSPKYKKDKALLNELKILELENAELYDFIENANKHIFKSINQRDEDIKKYLDKNK